MPTDPYVPSELADRPRQQQNLPPGLAPPPARDWRADRPGDLDAAGAAGSLTGSPGPNVGYAYTLAERARERLQLSPHEHAHDVVAVIAEIAGKRAALFGRAPVMGDIEIAITLLGYDGTADEQFIDARTRFTLEAAHDYVGRRDLVDSVAPDLLRLPKAELGPRVNEWRARVSQANLHP